MGWTDAPCLPLVRQAQTKSSIYLKISKKPVHACRHSRAKSIADHALAKLRDWITKMAVQQTAVGPPRHSRSLIKNLGRPTVKPLCWFLLFALYSAFALNVPCPVTSFLPAVPQQDVCLLPVPSGPSTHLTHCCTPAKSAGRAIQVLPVEPCFHGRNISTHPSSSSATS